MVIEVNCTSSSAQIGQTGQFDVVVSGQTGQPDAVISGQVGQVGQAAQGVQ
ncbi:MAG: hypothetical protein V7L23_09955 [Nostoc sp.]|uniref:hypothetical protein n=1 Tax=Nostoc sp. TaxID=1180 RepID=UPI002FF3A3F9